MTGPRIPVPAVPEDRIVKERIVQEALRRFRLEMARQIQKGFVTEAPITSDIIGNASTATALQTTRTIWGQNFNGTANVSGALTGVTSITMSSTLAVDTDTLFVDVTNNRVGIGTTGPSNSLHISQTSPVIRLTRTTDSGFHLIDGSVAGSLSLSADAGNTIGSSLIRFLVDGSLISSMSTTTFSMTGSVTATQGFNVNVAPGSLGVQWQDASVNRVIIRLDSATLWSINPRTSAGAGLDAALTLTLGDTATGAFSSTRPWTFMGTQTTATHVRIGATLTATSGSVRGMRIDAALIAAANSDTMYGIDVAPSITPGAFSGLTYAPIRVADNSTVMTGSKYGILVGAQSGATVNNDAIRSEGAVRVAGLFSTAVAAFAITTSVSNSAGSTARLSYVAGTVTATANNNDLVGLQIANTYTAGAFTGTTAYGLLISNVTGGATNYAIRTGTGTVRFDDRVEMLGSITPSNQAAFRNAQTITASSAVARTMYLNATLVAAANNDGLYGLQIQPSFTIGGFTGTAAYGLVVNDITGAATNYAIWTGTNGIVRHGDRISVDGTNTSGLARISAASTLTASGGVGRQFQAAGSIAAAANNDALSAFLISTTFSVGAFTGTQAFGVYINTISGAATNYAIYTNSGLVRFGDAVTVTSGGINVTGNSTITGTLGGLTGLTVASGGASITGNSTLGGTFTITSTTTPQFTTRYDANNAMTVATASSGATTITFTENGNPLSLVTLTGTNDTTGSSHFLTLSPTVTHSSSGPMYLVRVLGTMGWNSVTASSGAGLLVSVGHSNVPAVSNTFAQIEIGTDNVSGLNTKYGLLIGSITNAGATNYAFYTNSGFVRLGDVTGVGVSPGSFTNDKIFTVALAGAGTGTSQYVTQLTATLTSSATTAMYGLSVAYVGGAGTYTTTTVRSIHVAAFTKGASQTITTLAGIDVDASSVAATNSYGLRIGNITGATNNFSISTGTGAVAFGDIVAVGGATPSTTTYLITPASIAGVSSLRVPHGTAPSAPVNGDIWTTTAGLFVRINGVTVGPLT